MIENEPEKKDASFLLGLAADNKDGHIRYSKGENFHVLGGSDSTHKKLTEHCILFKEELAHRKKSLDDINPEEFVDINAAISKGKRYSKR